MRQLRAQVFLRQPVEELQHIRLHQRDRRLIAIGLGRVILAGSLEQPRRVDALNDRWNRMRRIIEARADDPDYAKAPGGTTGLLIKTYKRIGSGENAAGK